MTVADLRRLGRLAVMLIPAIMAVSGCSLAGYPSGGPAGPPAPEGIVASDLPDPASIPDAVPRQEHLSPYGNDPTYVALGHTYHVLETSKGYDQKGIASWYGPKFQGRRTSSGETFDMYAMTAAHRTLPLPTYVEVTNLDNGRKAIVKVNDRGPFKKNRLIDLSYMAARKLGFVGVGTAHVRVRAVGPPAIR
jgi:rare lipoprotein A